MDKVNVNKHVGMSVKSIETLETHLSTDIVRLRLRGWRRWQDSFALESRRSLITSDWKCSILVLLHCNVQYLVFSRSIQRSTIDGSHCDIFRVDVFDCSFWSGTAPPVVVVPTKVRSYGPEREETQQLKVLSYVLCNSIKVMQKELDSFGLTVCAYICVFKLGQ